MKSFLKFVMFVIIVVAILGTSMYLVNETKTIDTEKDNIVLDNSGGNLEIDSKNDELSGDSLVLDTILSGDEVSNEVIESGEIEFGTESVEELSGEVIEEGTLNIIENISGDIFSGENSYMSEITM